MFKPLCISLCAALAVSLSAAPALPSEADAPHIAMPQAETEPENTEEGKSITLTASFGAKPVEAIRRIPLVEEGAAPPHTRGGGVSPFTPRRLHRAAACICLRHFSHNAAKDAMQAKRTQTEICPRPFPFAARFASALRADFPQSVFGRCAAKNA